MVNKGYAMAGEAGKGDGYRPTNQANWERGWGKIVWGEKPKITCSVDVEAVMRDNEEYAKDHPDCIWAKVEREAVDRVAGMILDQLKQNG
jgi:hypothetical protein